jgi:TrmH family RNA methyltransferase
MLSRNEKKVILQLASRHGRKKSPYFISEGLRCCFEALRLRPTWIKAAYCDSSFLEHNDYKELVALLNVEDLSLKQLADSEFAELAQTENPQGLLFLLERPAESELFLPRPFCLILDQLREPGNLGTILRSCWAAGLKSLWLTKGCTDVYAAKVIRAGMGAQFALDIQILPSIQEAIAKFKELNGGDIWTTMPEAECSIFSDDFTMENSAIIIGNEASGVSLPELGKAVTIPMPGKADSLNAAQATSIIVFEAVRRKLLN